jgi:YVTN family beta-propeller protein
VAVDTRLTGTELAGYRVGALRGRGGMGEVYRALDLRLDRPVALKVLAPRLADDERFRDRMLRESRLAASLDHPNVIPVYEAGEADGRLFIAMRWVEGTDLKALLRRSGAIDPARAITLTAQVADALDAAHRRGLVHRDVKPSNVLVDAQGGHEHCYLADFGLTQSSSDRGPTDGQFMGTVDYVAPEQIRGDQVDGRADQYALGCMLFELLTGTLPFRAGSETATVFAHLEGTAPTATERRSDLLQGIDAVLSRAMEKQPADRFDTCGELVSAARSALGLDEPSRRSRRRRIVVTLGAVLAAGIAAVAVAVALLGRDAGPAAPTPGALIRIDPATNKVVSDTPLPGHPGNLAVSNGGIWIADFFAGSLERYTPSTGAIQRITSNGEPRDIAVAAGTVFVAADGDFLSGVVSRYDAVTGVRQDGLELLACAIAAGGGVVWVAGCPFVQRLSTDERRLRILRSVYLPFRTPTRAENTRGQFRELAVGGGSLWALGDDLDRRLWRLDQRTGRVLATIELGFPPRSAAFGGGRLWVTDSLHDTVVAVDASTGKVLRPTHVGRSPGGIVVAAGSVWVPNMLDGTVSRLDPATRRVISTIDVGHFPREIAAGDGSIWVTAYAR